MHLYRRLLDAAQARVRAMSERPPVDASCGVLFIGCTDSPLSVGDLIAAESSTGIVHRNLANIVPHADLNVQCVIEHAVEHLEVEHIIVCGHYGCRAVQAATRDTNLGILNEWLREVRDVYRLHRAEIDALPNRHARHRRLVELNVREQCIHVLKTAAVQRHVLKRSHPIVHGWVLDLEAGELRDLHVRADEILEEIRQIYHLDV